MTEVLQAVLPAGALALGGGVLFGWFLKGRTARAEAARTRGQSDEALHRTRREAEDQNRQALLTARQEWLATKGRLEQEIRARSQEVQQAQRALEEREVAQRDRDARLLTREQEIETREKGSEAARAETARERERLRKTAVEINGQLSALTGLTLEDARQMQMANIRQEVRFDMARLIREAREEAQKRAEMEAGKIVSLAIERTAAEWTAERSVSVFPLANDKLKGRIIGHEGKNIRAFEKATGVQLLMDDQPGAVVLSCFNPIKREVAKLTLERLLRDGNISPARIDQLVERQQHRVEELMLRAGQDALRELGIQGVHPEMVKLLGRLRYRTSYGQNVLKHLVESAHIAALMAAELGLDVAHCKRAAFLHDIGKALTHEVEGSHAIVGADLARKYGEHADVVHAIEAHHNEVEVRTVEAVLVQAADAISGSRPGARRESIEAYVQRLERLEEIAAARDGVDKVFAMQAGREIRVMVAPDVVDDIEAQVLARDIAKQIEEELTYPGQIKVTVVRESRATETAR